MECASQTLYCKLLKTPEENKKRKASMFYDRLVLFVEYALLIKGARRVGKSTIAEEFAKKSLNRIF